MKTIIFTVFFTMFTLFIVSAQKQSDPNIKTVKIQTSAHTVQCKAKIEKTLAFEKGVIESELDKKTQVLTVKYKINKTNVDNIIKVITDLGHSAEEIKESEKDQKK